jgi:four helix bundle protein
VNYDEWLKTVPPEITGDSIWKTTVYRQALFLGELAWFDVCKLAQVRQTLALSEQLYDSVGGISATICEGYSRASEKDQARFYEYALGSARETRDWYYKGRYVLGEIVADHRMKLTVHVIRQLLKMVPEYRGRKIREEVADYHLPSLDDLLNDVPMPATDSAPQ